MITFYMRPDQATGSIFRGVRLECVGEIETFRLTNVLEDKAFESLVREQLLKDLSKAVNGTVIKKIRRGLKAGNSEIDSVMAAEAYRATLIDVLEYLDSGVQFLGAEKRLTGKE
jgi:hypothetical protein